MAIVIKPKAPGTPIKPGTLKADAPDKPTKTKVAANAVDDEPAPPVQLTAKAGKATVTKEYKDGTITEETHDFPVVPVEGPAATVSMSMGLTRNLGNYESVKFSVSLSLPCAPVEEEVNKTFHTVRGWIDTTVETVNQEISAQLA